MKSKLVLPILAFVLFAGMCIIENEAVTARPPQPKVDSASSVYMLAGEFRTVFANLLWVKVEQYHHEFISHEKDWTKNHELLGLLNLITTLDPHFEQAYEVGTSLYENTPKGNRQAMDYLMRGIDNNPKTWELHKLAAIMYARKFNRPDLALPHAQMALKYCDDKWFVESLQGLTRTIKKLSAEQGAQKSAPLQSRKAK